MIIFLFAGICCWLSFKFGVMCERKHWRYNEHFLEYSVTKKIDKKGNIVILD